MLSQLECFLAVARTGHFTRAAADVHLAQPSLSRQISSLEHDLGAALFNRARGNITLTAAGEALLPLATRMMDDAARARSGVADLTGLRRGRVRLGAIPSLCTSLVADLLHRYCDDFPGIEIRLTERGSRALIDQLVGGMLDAALIVSHEDRAESALEVVPLLREDLVVVSAATEPPLTRSAELTLGELAGRRLIGFDENYDLRRATDEALRAAGVVPNIAVDGAEMDGVLRLVERGVGIAVVPSLVVFSRPGLRAVRLQAPELTRTIALARRADMEPTHALRAMFDILATVVDAAAAMENSGLTPVARVDLPAQTERSARSGSPR